jgi:hypothetical protein
MDAETRGVLRLGGTHHGGVTDRLVARLTLRRAVAGGLVAAAFVSGPAPGSTQPLSSPPSPPAPQHSPPRSTPPRFGRAMPANICSTELGWCQLSSRTAPHGASCWCLTEEDTAVPGITRYWPYEGPPSPYVRPHVAPPSTIR